MQTEREFLKNVEDALLKAIDTHLAHGNVEQVNAYRVMIGEVEHRLHHINEQERKAREGKG